ncbi:MAG: glycoside hydrolase family protein [Candidatus Pacebacteria bacterium]|jgi:lysozyme|nr:glycoside hydrolase family protein [Candidatus Paceibacterota bacterium]|tara:strand:+ start:3087 stop:3605 length:519 start_codon:yes stop_codon:yes gene_type:complete
MNLEQLKTELIDDEGIRLDVYLDSEGYPTVGIGHLIEPKDNFLYHVGETISEELCDVLFLKDLDEATVTCHKTFSDFYTYPEDVQHVLLNMAFNLGQTRFGKFKNMIAAVKSRDWETAADEMKDSRWYHQVGGRSVRLVQRMREANHITNKYTQRQWDRVVGYGKVPKEYKQ